MTRPRPLAASVAAVASLVAASLCCLPLPTMMVAAGLAGASAFTDALRPWLVAFSLAALAVAFWQAYRNQRCSRRHRALVWFAALFMAAFLAFPQVFAGFVAGRAGAADAAAAERLDLQRLRERFNADGDRTRLILLLSPT
ncbi:MAG: hypothetical protein HYZ57_01635 [Acidobacteria bacterium]|nr:hypothetical protein [Acidobacteriota bacterium]MBI3278525.1 hypothetical protein [Acidobacteriota bacterium]